jgi:sec-independent protein translocase protein TatA
MISSTGFFVAVMGLGAPELIIILVILLVLFGGSKLPGLAKGLGQSIKEFKKSSKDDPEPEPTPAKAPDVEVKKPETPVRHGSN